MKHRCALPLFLFIALGSHAQNPVRITLVPWAENLGPVVDLAHCNDDRIFVVRQFGRIDIITDSMTVLPIPFLDISSRVSYGGEEGLLGLAFDPDYATNGHFYVDHVDTLGDLRVSRYTVTADPNVADPASEVLVYHQPHQPYSNHNAGDLDFGPDGNLYVPFGDGGSGCDPQGNGQDLSDARGDIIRIHVEADGSYTIPADNPYASAGPDTLPEIWASGLRNPFRFGFDRLTGDLWLGDVGQNAWEEIDMVPAGDNSGRNFGWDCREGFTSSNGNGSWCDTTGCPPASAFDDPVVAQMNNGQPGGTWCSIIGGRVYRGAAWPHLYGRYFYTDHCAMQFRSLRPDGLGGWIDEQVMQNQQPSFTCIGEDADGELFTGNLGVGKVFKIIDACPMDPPAITQVGADLESSAADGYQWFLNGDTIPGATGQVYSPSISGDYFVMADFGSPCVLSSDTITWLSVGMEAGTAVALHLGPVPANDLLTISWTGADVHRWRLIDAGGRALAAGPVAAHTFTIPTGRFATGACLMQLLSADGAVVAARAVIIVR